MAETMAEVIHAAHCLERVHGEDCTFWADDVISAAALSAAGFGLVADAGAKALENAADDFENLPVNRGAEISSGTWDWFELFPLEHIRARAASIRSTNAHD